MPEIALDLIGRERGELLNEQFKQVIRGAIRAGIYKPGEHSESEQTFVQSSNLIKRAIAHAFNDLVQEGIVGGHLAGP